MYEAHWELKNQLFPSGLDPDRFYESPVHEEALARLFFLVEQRRRLGLLLGPGGCGKSLLFHVLARDLRRKGHQVAMIDLLSLDAHEFVWTLADRLGANPKFDAPLFRLWRGVLDRLASNRLQQISTIVLLDDADEAETEVLGNVIRLAQSEWMPTSRLTIVLGVDSARVSLLDPRLIELSELRMELASWDENETTEFLKHAFAQAGRQAPVFSEKALTKLQQLAGGVPRRVIQLADLSLLAGAGENLSEIDDVTIQAVHQELGGHLSLAGD